MIFMPQKRKGSRRLPVVDWSGKKWFADLRLREIRNIKDPYEVLGIPPELKEFDLFGFKSKKASR